MLSNTSKMNNTMVWVQFILFIIRIIPYKAVWTLLHLLIVTIARGSVLESFSLPTVTWPNTIQPTCWPATSVISPQILMYQSEANTFEPKKISFVNWTQFLVFPNLVEELSNEVESCDGETEQRRGEKWRTSLWKCWWGPPGWWQDRSDWHWHIGEQELSYLV